jgi:hypothetical protein
MNDDIVGRKIAGKDELGEQEDVTEAVWRCEKEYTEQRLR